MPSRSDRTTFEEITPPREWPATTHFGALCATHRATPLYPDERDGVTALGDGLQQRRVRHGIDERSRKEQKSDVG